MECNKKLTMVQEACSKAEKEVKKLQNELSSERDAWEARLEERLEAERRDVQPHAHGSTSPQLRMDIPSVSSRQKLVPEKIDKASPHNRRLPSSSGHGLTSATLPNPDRPVSRRHSGQPSQISGNGVPLRQDSRSSTPQLSTANGMPESPFTQREPNDDFFDGVVTPATPDRTINEMFSVSTAAAGPSLQLVERMSAAVRRLESEKATLKDELDRLSIQRDEAREQVVTLMREVEEKRASDAKVHELEAQVAEINQRYEATLEMLGEKSELVDELKADVADLKQMYRDLVDSTMR
jgi:DNA repair exonuclease SbcCD ATPase subunit